MAKFPLRSQSAAFWLGVFMIAEAPIGIAILALSQERRASLLDYLFGNPIAALCALIALIGLGLMVGWLAHRLGLGE